MMRFLKKTILHDNVWCMIFVFAVMWGGANIPINTEIINPLDQALDDFEINDLVFSTLRDEPEADTNIVIVNLGTLNREGIAQLLRNVNRCEPVAVGIDAFFRHLKDPRGDSLLARAFQETKNLVLVSKIDRPNEKGEFDTLETSHPLFIQYANLAYANMITKEKEFRTSRTFAPIKICKGKEEEFFGIKVARYFNMQKVDRFLARKKEVEIINYRGNVYSGDMYNMNLTKFSALDVDDILNNNFSPSLIKGKIVLIGYVGESLYNVRFWDEDKFYTPMNKKYAGKSFPDMFGVVVHANIISMILHENAINVLDKNLELVINILLCLINVIIFSFFYKKMPLMYDGFSALVQLVESLIMILASLYIFAYFRMEVSLTLATIFLLLLGNFLDLYYGLLKVGLNTLIEKFQLKKVLNDIKS